ncbi:MAG: hypothetical protein KAK00_04000 [Nanoarchaeota archaeon]|nr:hypothetical protein [Nanoarchaeota archaeon]
MNQKKKIRARAIDIFLGVIGGGFLGMSLDNMLNKYLVSLPQWVYVVELIIGIILLIFISFSKAKSEIKNE